MMGYPTQDERDAFKAGIRKAEKAAALSGSLQADALSALWALLGAANQTEAVQRVNGLLAEIELQKNLVADRGEALSERGQMIAALHQELTASRAMSAHYMKVAKHFIDGATFSRGQSVVKKEGYNYPGEVVCVFRNKIGQIRYVVEATGVGYEGMLHIFNGDQLTYFASKPEAGDETYDRYIQRVGRAARPMPAEAPEIKDLASGEPLELVKGAVQSKSIYGGTSAAAAMINRASITVDEFTKAIAEVQKKLFGID